MQKRTLYAILSSVILFLAVTPLTANEVEIVDVKTQQNADKTWRFDVTLKHADEGWDHYANEWQVLAPDNKILATRTLYHPHVHEQPFTRSISGVKIPQDLSTVYIIAKDTVHGLSPHAVGIELNNQKLTKITIEDLKKLRKQ